MTAQEAKQRLERIWKAYTSAYDTVSIEDLMAFDMAINSLGAIEQIQWERDMAIKQLHDLGYGLGEKPRDVPGIHVGKTDFKPETVTNCHGLMDDLISRQAAIDALHTWFRDGFDEDKWWNSTHVLAAIEGLPPVQQEHKWETCFECPLSHGCPKIKGCTNEQAIEYASQIPNDCPLSAQPESCEGCIQYGLWENEIEYGYSSPCTRCKRRANDNYER